MTFLSYVGMMANYTMHFWSTPYCNNPPTHGWHQDHANGYFINKVAEWTQKGYTCYRLTMKFTPSNRSTSLYKTDLFNEVLTAFNGVGAKVIADLHDSDLQPDHPSIRTDWLNFLSNHGNDSRLVGINLYNEIGMTGVASKDLTSTPTKITKFYTDLTREIHAIYPNLHIFFPTPQHYYVRDYTLQNFIDDVLASNILNDITTTHDNLSFDVWHEYFWENAWDEGKTPEQKAIDTMNKNLLMMNAFGGSHRCWMGETWAWTGLTANDHNPTHPHHQAPHQANPNLQGRWHSSILNALKNNGIPFISPGLWKNISLSEKTLPVFTNDSEPTPNPPVFECVVNDDCLPTEICLNGKCVLKPTPTLPSDGDLANHIQEFEEYKTNNTLSHNSLITNLNYTQKQLTEVLNRLILLEDRDKKLKNAYSE